ncbi:hypothetical protein GCM10010517_11770 [Streptosporangium fragile]|uniref:Uncharacterized protein n=1 Tax=Streptosporangium fragile TaxID=46186 RepID=A0ABP6I8H0_9ACTN
MDETLLRERVGHVGHLEIVLPSGSPQVTSGTTDTTEMPGNVASRMGLRPPEARLERSAPGLLRCARHTPGLRDASRRPAAIEQPFGYIEQATTPGVPSRKCRWHTVAFWQPIQTATIQGGSHGT